MPVGRFTVTANTPSLVDFIATGPFRLMVLPNSVADLTPGPHLIVTVTGSAGIAIDGDTSTGTSAAKAGVAAPIRVARPAPAVTIANTPEPASTLPPERAGVPGIPSPPRRAASPGRVVTISIHVDTL